MATATQPRRPRASNSETGMMDESSSNKLYFGNKFTKPSVQPARLRSVKDPKKLFPNTFRLLGIADPDNPGKFDPPRVAADEPGAAPMLTDFIESYLFARVGDPGINFILFDPLDHPNESADSLKWKYPLTLIYQGIKNAGKANEGEVWWQTLITGGNNNKPAVVTFPKLAFFAYAAIYEQGDTAYETPLGLDPAEPPILLDLGSMAGRAIRGLCKQLKPEYAKVFEGGGSVPDDVAINKLFEIFNPIAVKTGVFFRAYGVDSKNLLAYARKKDPEAKIWTPAAVDEDTTKKGSLGYEVFAQKTINGEPASIEDQASWLWKRLKPIREHLIFPTAGEQVDMLSRVIKDPSGKPAVKLLQYVFESGTKNRDVDTEAWLADIPSEVLAMAKGRVTSLPAGKGKDATAEDARRRDRGRPADDEDVDDDDVAVTADEDEEDEVDLSRSKGKGGRTKTKVGKTKEKVDASVPKGKIEDDEDDADELEDEELEDEEDDDVDDEDNEEAEEDDDDDIEEEEDDDDVEEEEDEDDEPAPVVTKKSKTGKKAPMEYPDEPPVATRKKAKAAKPVVAEEEEEEEEEEPAPKKKSAKVAKTDTARRPKPVEDDDEDGDDDKPAKKLKAGNDAGLKRGQAALEAIQRLQLGKTKPKAALKK